MEHINGGGGENDPGRYHDVEERYVNPIVVQLDTQHDLSCDQLEDQEDVEDLPHDGLLSLQPVSAGGPAVRDHGEDQLDEKYGVVQPERDENYEPAPSDSLVQPQCQQDEEHQTDEPGEQGPVEDCHYCLLF